MTAIECLVVTCKFHDKNNCTKDKILINADNLNRYYEDVECNSFERDEEKAKPYIVWE